VAYYLLLDNRRRMPPSAYLKEELAEASDAMMQYPTGTACCNRTNCTLLGRHDAVPDRHGTRQPRASRSGPGPCHWVAGGEEGGGLSDATPAVTRPCVLPGRAAPPILEWRRVSWGRGTAAECPILHARQDQVHPIGLSDAPCHRAE
jgi:hypothetical protein